VNEASRRRFNLIPFTVTIPKDERDGKLSEKLKEEWPAILRWGIDGCLLWQRVGLNVPKPVSDATADYLNAEDSIEQWIGDCCRRSPAATELTADLFASFKAWAERTGEFCGSQKRFAQQIAERGFERWRDSRGRMGFVGLSMTLNSGLQQ
jgi:putative DNA primase/helicase